MTAADDRALEDRIHREAVDHGLDLPISISAPKKIVFHQLPSQGRRGVGG